MKALDYRGYFARPAEGTQRRYEALRAVFIEEEAMQMKRELHELNKQRLQQQVQEGKIDGRTVLGLAVRSGDKVVEVQSGQAGGWLVPGQGLFGAIFEVRDEAEEHLQLLRWISYLARNRDFRRFVQGSESEAEIRDLLHEMADV